jgi:hypothetical protein
VTGIIGFSLEGMPMIIAICWLGCLALFLELAERAPLVEAGE